MNDSLSGADLREREPAGRSRGEAPPAKDGRPAPSRAPQRPRWSGPEVLSLAISILALIVAGTALCLVLRGYEGPEGPSGPPEDEPVTFRFGDMVLTPLEGMPLAPYDKDAFGRDEKGRVTYEADGRRAKAGIDVSTHQKDIDWPSVAADGIDFAMLRLGLRGYARNGKVLEDTAFRQNLQGALDAELDVGVYFFSQAITVEEAEEEAQFVLDTLDGQALDLPVAFDWEPILGDEARTDGLDGATATRCAVAFCEKIQEAGYQAAVYFNQNQGYLHYDLRDLKDYVLWLAEYGTVPDFYYHFDMWQYTHRGQVDGIQGDVDLDLLF